MSNDIMVSVICNTFNHEKYIADALEGFVMQKTNFKFEVLVHDDASTDSTADIIREYERQYSDIIKPIYQTENQYSKGIKISMVYNYPRVQGKYIAYCEGDDYWTDPLKLQKQYDAMENHPDVDICAHSAQTVQANTKEFVSYMSPSENDCILTTEQVIAGGGGYIATNSLFFRTKLIRNIPEFRRMLAIDYTMQIHGALRGGMLYLNDCMAVYRVLSDNSWTSRMQDQKEKLYNHLLRVEQMLLKLDEETKYIYTDVIKEKIIYNRFQHYIKFDEFENIKAEPYKTFFRKLPFKRKSKILLKRLYRFLKH